MGQLYLVSDSKEMYQLASKRTSYTWGLSKANSVTLNSSRDFETSRILHEMRDAYVFITGYPLILYFVAFTVDNQGYAHQALVELAKQYDLESMQARA